MSFNAIPILDLSLSRSPATKPSFLNDLCHALLEVGFLYIKNTGLSPELIRDVIEQGKAFFDLPMEKKLEIEMKNAPSFLGYNKLGMEITRFKTDWREQIDLSTEHPIPGLDERLYHNLLAPNQWPDSALLPHFRPSYERYLREMGEMSIYFTSLIAEAVGLPRNAFDRFFDKAQQHKVKIVKYPDLDELGVEGEAQGVGPHKDSMLTSYLLQASHHKGLQVQAPDGKWIDCPPIDGTLVVAIGQGMQALTQGVCQSTTHRVLSPARGSGPRFSIPFFQGVSYDATFENMDVPQSVKELRSRILEQRGERIDDIEFTFMSGRYRHLGEATLMNRIKSHPDVGEKFVGHPPLLHVIVLTYPSILTCCKRFENNRRKTRSNRVSQLRHRNHNYQKRKVAHHLQQSKHINNHTLPNLP